MSGGGPLIEARDLMIGYAPRVVGRDMQLSAGQGEVLCLLGPNGSGKTTLFKTLLGLLPALGGSVRLRADRLAELSRREIAQRVSYVPQAHSAQFPFAVLEMVTMGRTAHLGPFAQPGPRDRQRALDALSTLGIASLADAAYTDISGGQRQLVLIARALAQDASLVVMDEPTANLDFGNQALVLREVKRMRLRGLGVILSTHDPDHALAVGDRVAFLDAGRIVACGAPAEVLTAARLSTVYGIDVSVERLKGGQLVCAPDLGEPGA